MPTRWTCIMLLTACILLGAGLGTGCVTYDSGIPEAMESQVDKGLTFAKLKDAPDSYRGLLVVYSGEVLAATLTHEGTRLEVLQLPTIDGGEPTGDRTHSQGRFLALHRGFLDPATVPAGTRVTVVGSVVGATTKPLDETEYTYPTLEVKNLKIWPDIRTYRYGYYPSYPYYWGPFYGRFGWYYPYWW